MWIHARILLFEACSEWTVPPFDWPWCTVKIIALSFLHDLLQRWHSHMMSWCEYLQIHTHTLYSYPAVLSQRIQHNFDANSKRDILRGTWYFQKSDGTLYPYTEEIAAELESAFRTGGHGRGVEVDDKRVVYRAMEQFQYAQVVYTFYACKSVCLCACVCRS